MSTPTPPSSTHALDACIVAAGNLSRPSNSKWDGLGTWLADALGLAREDVYPVYVSKQGNLTVRFSQRAGRKRLGVGVLKNHEELDACTASARRLVGPGEMYDAIALCVRPADGPWTVASIVRADDDDLAAALRTAFPAAHVHDPVAPSRPPASDIEGLADRLFVDRAWLERVVWLLQDKQGVVFYGPPGTGKTYIARAIAAHFQPDPRLNALVQLHPSYGYEDFFEGYRPVSAGSTGGLALERTPGPLRVLHDAAERAKQDAFLVLDEMNRANLPKVFGELFFALEYRETPVRLMYDPTESFVLGRRIHVLGTMNTSDRSIAVLDQALRRRFHFVPLYPGRPVVDGIFERFLATRHPSMRWLADVLRLANQKLGDPNVAIGPSHFMRQHLDEEVAARVWQYSVLPTIEEHFFGDRGRLEDFGLEVLRAAVARDADVDDDA